MANFEDFSARNEFASRKRTVQGSLILWLLSRNLPLGHWPQYEGSREAADFQGGYSAIQVHFSSEKRVDNAARKIINALSQYSVAERMEKEWEIFPSILRMRITAIANEVMTGHAHISNSVTKGIKYADDLLGGKILARYRGPSEMTLKIVDGRKVAVRTRINSAVAGAERAFGGFVRPPNYATMSKAQKKAINRSLAADRREFKRRK